MILSLNCFAEVKYPPVNAGDMGLIPGLGRSPGVGNGNTLQYSCLENSKARGAWWATVTGVVKSQTQLSTHVHTHTHTRNTLGRNSLDILHVFKEDAYWCPFMPIFFLSKLNIFIWLPWALVATHRIFNFHCAMWDLVPWLGIEHGLPTLGMWSLSHWATGKSLCPFLNMLLLVCL